MDPVHAQNAQDIYDYSAKLFKKQSLERQVQALNRDLVKLERKIYDRCDTAPSDRIQRSNYECTFCCNTNFRREAAQVENGLENLQISAVATLSVTEQQQQKKSKQPNDSGIGLFSCSPDNGSSLDSINLSKSISEGHDLTNNRISTVDTSYSLSDGFQGRSTSKTSTSSRSRASSVRSSSRKRTRKNRKRTKNRGKKVSDSRPVF